MGRLGDDLGRLRRRLVLLWVVDGRGGGSGIGLRGVLGGLGVIQLLVRGGGACRSRGAFCSLHSGVVSNPVGHLVGLGLVGGLLRFCLTRRGWAWPWNCCCVYIDFLEY